MGVICLRLYIHSWHCSWLVTIVWQGQNETKTKTPPKAAESRESNRKGVHTMITTAKVRLDGIAVRDTLFCRNHGSRKVFNPFTPKSDQFQISPTAHQKYYLTQYLRTWRFIFYSDDRWLHCQILTSSLIPFSLKGLGECTFWTWQY